jgi:hypothetical protein
MGSVTLLGDSRAFTALHPRLQILPYSLPTSSRGKGAWPATVAVTGCDRAGTGPRGILGRSGDLVAGQARPPSAWLKAKESVLACSGPLSSTVEPTGNGKARVPVRPEQGHLTGRWRITIARSVGLRRNGISLSKLRTLSGAPRPFPSTRSFRREVDEARSLPLDGAGAGVGVTPAVEAARGGQLSSHPIPNPSPSRGRGLNDQDRNAARRQPFLLKAQERRHDRCRQRIRRTGRGRGHGR